MNVINSILKFAVELNRILKKISLLKRAIILQKLLTRNKESSLFLKDY